MAEGFEDDRGDRAFRGERRHAGRPTPEAALALTQRIVDAAQALFLTQGYAATSLQQIATAAGATKRTLYVKVGDKAMLFAAVVHRLLDRKQEALALEGVSGATEARLTSFGTDVLANSLDPDVLRLNRLLVAEARRFPELVTLMEAQMMQGSVGRLTELLREEVKWRRLVLDDPHMSAQLLLGMIIGMPQRAVVYGQAAWTPERIAAWVRAAIGLFLVGSRPQREANRVDHFAGGYNQIHLEHT